MRTEIVGCLTEHDSRRIWPNGQKPKLIRFVWCRSGRPRQSSDWTGFTGDVFLEIRNGGDRVTSTPDPRITNSILDLQPVDIYRPWVARNIDKCQMVSVGVDHYRATDCGAHSECCI